MQNEKKVFQITIYPSDELMSKIKYVSSLLKKKKSRFIVDLLENELIPRRVDFLDEIMRDMDGLE